MAYAFPLTTAQFMDRLPIQEITFDPAEAMEVSETGGGEILTADLGTRLWKGQIALGDMTPDEAAEVMPLIDILRRGAGSFMVHDVSHPAPRNDPTGSILGVASPVLHSVHANMRDIRLGGLPIGYQIRPHDYVAFSYGSNPVRYALHRVAIQRSAASDGTTGWVEVSPNIRPGFTAGAAVTLMKASCKAIIVPGSFQPGRRKATMTAGVSFDFIQTLR